MDLPLTSTKYYNDNKLVRTKPLKCTVLKGAKSGKTGRQLLLEYFQNEETQGQILPFKI